jgi:hypothetical protein
MLLFNLALPHSLLLFVLQCSQFAFLLITASSVLQCLLFPLRLVKYRKPLTRLQPRASIIRGYSEEALLREERNTSSVCLLYLQLLWRLERPYHSLETPIPC